MINLNSPMTEHYNAHDWSRVFLSLSIIPHVEKWLDCGVGDGSISQLIKQVVGTVDVLEIDDQHIESLSNLKNEGLIDGYHCSGNVTKMPFDDNSFDGLSIFETLEHLTDEDLAMAVKEIKRVVKPDGWIVLSVPLRDAIQDPDHKQEFESEEIVSMFPYGDFHQQRLMKDQGRATLWWVYKTKNIK